MVAARPTKELSRLTVACCSGIRQPGATIIRDFQFAFFDPLLDGASFVVESHDGDSAAGGSSR